MNYKIYTTLATFIAIFALPVKSSTADTTQQINQQAKQYLYSVYSSEQPLARTVIKLNPLSAKLNIKACSTPITFIHTPARSVRATLKAQCSAPKWTFFLSANIEQWLKIATTTRPLSKGTILGGQEVFLLETDVRRLHKPYFIDLGELFGRKLKRNLGRHKPITSAHLGKQFLIRNGDLVYIKATKGNMIVRMTGTALENGTRGEQISIKNNRSGKVIRGYVVDKGVVSVTP
ncbi:MAG: flagellar basal body P-ring formation chaperone FlgA [Amphritea sp.]